MSEYTNLTKNGEYFKVYGLYQYAGHVDTDHHYTCHIPKVAYCMIFQKGDMAPDLPSCSHDINWVLLARK